MSEQKEQAHPQYRSDRATVNQLLAEGPTDFNLAELGRLIIRYKGFPGARDIQKDLEKVLSTWKLTEDELYEKTRVLHQRADIYQNLGRNREDWS
ncbi:MAG: DUF3288 family protein [Leptolyngbya sp. SIO1E4]|nr:DUF3288 family protein [Leptolyngbya sp. SIO1E4]